MGDSIFVDAFEKACEKSGLAVSQALLFLDILNKDLTARNEKVLSKEVVDKIIDLPKVDKTTNSFKSNSQDCLRRICNELLGEDFYIASPVGGNQGNEIITDIIIDKYKKYNLKHRLKSVKKVKDTNHRIY